MMILSAVAFIACNIMIYKYAKKVFTIIAVDKRNIVMVAIVNTIFFLISVSEFTNLKGALMSAIYLFILFAEFKILFKSNNLFTFFLSFYFATFLSTIRMMVTSIGAYMEKEYIHIYVSSYDNELLNILSTYSIMAICLLILEKVLPTKVLILAMSYKESMTFAITALATIYAYIMLNRDIIYLESNTFEVVRLNLQNGLGSLLTFGSVIFYTFAFSKSKMYKKQNEFMENQIVAKKKRLEEITAQTNIDHTTKLATREVVEKKIRSNIEEGKEFSVIFMDEGDFYIKNVGEILNTVFYSDVIARFGGDEFVAVINEGDEYSIKQKALICVDNVGKIKEFNKKEYDTSISYGLVNVKANAKYSVEEILDMADKKMYEYERRNKKQRENYHAIVEEATGKEMQKVI